VTSADTLQGLTPAGTLNLPGLKYLNFTVTFDDATQLDVHADHRDLRRAGTHANAELDPIGFAYACCWSYLTRTKQITIGFAEFLETVPFCDPVDDPDAATADPTGTATADS
jgi:hypothetical protein